MNETDGVADIFSNLSSEDFLNLNLNNLNETNKSQNMSTSANGPKINWDLFKSKLDNIKPFDGNSNTLNKFIKRCDDLVAKYQTFNDNDLNTHVFECITERLIGRAEAMIGNRVELDNWEKLKLALLQCFSDRRDLDCLVQELTRARPQKSEHILNFGNRIQLLRSSVIQRVSNSNISELEKLCHISYYEKTALNTFIAGCTGTLKNNMHIKKPVSLEDAMAYVSEFENFEKLYNGFSDPQKLTKNNYQTQKPAQFQNFQSPNQMYNNFSAPPMNLQPHTFNTKPDFPSQPLNVQPRTMPFRQYPTNRQVFGKPQNVFRPNQIQTNQLPRPTPMSTTSRNPTMMTNRGNFQNKPQNNNFFRNQYPNQRPNFISQELYSNEYGNDSAYAGNTYDEAQDNFGGYSANYCYDPHDPQNYNDYQSLDYNQIVNDEDIHHEQPITTNQNSDLDSGDTSQNFQEISPQDQQI